MQILGREERRNLNDGLASRTGHVTTIARRAIRPLLGQKVDPMLKITVHDTSGQIRLALEDRLAGIQVAELEQCWHTAKVSARTRYSRLTRPASSASIGPGGISCS